MKLGSAGTAVEVDGIVDGAEDGAVGLLADMITMTRMRKGGWKKAW